MGAMERTQEIEAAVNALFNHWENPARESSNWEGHSPVLLTVLAWILDEWVPAEA